MVGFVSDEVAKKVRHIRREILPGGRRDHATSSYAEPDQFNDPPAAPGQRACQLCRPNSAAINAPRDHNAVVRSQHLDPHASDVVNVRRDRSHRSARRTGNILRPQLVWQILDEVHRYSISCTPRGDQCLAVFGIFRHLLSSRYWLRARRNEQKVILLYGLAETQPISVAVVNFEVATTVYLVTEITGDRYLLRLKLLIKCVGVFDPNVRVPGSALGIHQAVWAHSARAFKLGQHDDDARSLHHTKGRWLVPKSLIRKSKFVPVVVCRGHHVVNDEKWGDRPN